MSAVTGQSDPAGVTRRHLFSNRLLNSSPLLLLLLCAALLMMPLRLPIGPNYWDLAIFTDAAHRMNLGQWPNVDFRTPAGPLVYFQYAWMEKLFPHGHPALIASWSALPLASLLFSLTLSQIADYSNRTKLALVLPFLFFAFLPFNSSASFPVPGIDAFGIYNRQPALLLFILVTLLIFARNSAITLALIAVTVIAIMLTKITGFAAAALILIYAGMAGRFTLRDSILLLALIALPLAVLEISTGLLSAYTRNVFELFSMNEGSILSRLAFIGAMQFDILAALFAIWIMALLLDREKILGAIYANGSLAARIRNAISLPSVRFSVLLVASLAFELQNTGSQEYVFLWPAMVAFLREAWRQSRRLNLVMMLAIAFATIPVAVSIFHRAARTAVASIRYVPLDAGEIGRLGAVSTRQAFALRAQVIGEHYAQNREAYERLSRKGESPSIDISVEPDFQFLWLMQARDAITALRKLEKDRNRPIESMLVMDFADPITRAMGKPTPRLVQIGRDPDRTIRWIDAAAREEIAKTEILLAPACPPLPIRDRLLEKFQLVLDQRTKVPLTPCWDIYIKKPGAS